jgi:hypothetical protein
MSIENCSMPSITGFNPFSSTTNMLSIENCMLFTVFYVLLMSSFYYSAIIITQYYTRNPTKILAGSRYKVLRRIVYTTTSSIEVIS